MKSDNKHQTRAIAPSYISRVFFASGFLAGFVAIQLYTISSRWESAWPLTAAMATTSSALIIITAAFAAKIESAAVRFSFVTAILISILLCDWLICSSAFDHPGNFMDSIVIWVPLFIAIVLARHIYKDS